MHKFWAAQVFSFPKKRASQGLTWKCQKLSHGFSLRNGFTLFCLKISGTLSSLHISGPVLLFLNGNVICPALRAQWIELYKEGLIWILIQSRLLDYLVELWSWVNHKLCTRAIITLSYFETTVNYKPWILDPKIEEFLCLLHKFVCNTNRSTI